MSKIHILTYNAIPSSLLKVLSSVCPTLDETLDLSIRCSVGLGERHAHHLALELDIGGRDWVLLDARLYLTAGVRDLADHQSTLFLALRGHGLESIEALSLVRGRSRNDGVSGSFKVIIFEPSVQVSEC